MLRIYKDARHSAQKWNVGPEYRKRLEQPCGYFGKRTPFLRWRAQLQTGYEGERSGTNHWKQTPQGTWNKSCGCLLKWMLAL